MVLAAASAHELKVLASRLALPDGPGKVTVYLSWGHRLPVDELIDGAVVERYELIDLDGKSFPLKATGLSLQAHSINLERAGLYQLIARRKAGISTYVIGPDGKRQMKRGPKSVANGATIDSSQRSIQSAKSLIVVGTPSEIAPEPVGLPLEIVPIDGPAKWTTRELHLRVLRDGKPAAGVDMVGRSFHSAGDEWPLKATTDANGMVTLRPATSGTLVLKAQVKTPAAEHVRDQYDTESLTTTLTLDVRP